MNVSGQTPQIVQLLAVAIVGSPLQLDHALKMLVGVHRARSKDFHCSAALFEEEIRDRYQIEEKLSSIGGTMTWIMRLVIGGLLLGVIAFLLKGGFNLP